MARFLIALPGQGTVVLRYALIQSTLRFECAQCVHKWNVIATASCWRPFIDQLTALHIFRHWKSIYVAFSLPCSVSCTPPEPVGSGPERVHSHLALSRIGSRSADFVCNTRFGSVNLVRSLGPRSEMVFRQSLLPAQQPRLSHDLPCPWLASTVIITCTFNIDPRTMTR